METKVHMMHIPLVKVVMEAKAMVPNLTRVLRAAIQIKARMETKALMEQIRTIAIVRMFMEPARSTTATQHRAMAQTKTQRPATKDGPKDLIIKSPTIHQLIINRIRSLRALDIT